ncbi:YciI family protein [Ramlibacter alkalitolerans]|uniref:Transcription initiation protein n=1 Tax=Ramlibacter alkalitolerans TaxID=2039631 RepID=A0ABS1JMB4_9BURK|nr:YciI family protein [Ramlibacter alkalitolerans]MBL0425389.1 transcription initiation protein [Ramlibacter alkalitolerans]
MKFLCLAYGDEAGWNALSEADKARVTAADDVIRRRGSLMAAVRPEVRTVRNWEDEPVVTTQAYAQHALALAGFSVIEADAIEEVIGLVAETPCARAGGYIEIRPFWNVADS